MPILSNSVRAEAREAELSAEDIKTLSYYQEPTLDMRFEDNEVWVILKSAYDYLTELKFSDLKIVEDVSSIDHIWYELKEYTCEDRTVPFKKGYTNYQFKIVLEKHGKEKVLAVCKLLQTLDMVLVAEPNYIYDIDLDYKPNDGGYFAQWGLNDTYGIKAEQAWDVTRGSANVKVGIMEYNIDVDHVDLNGRVYYGNLTHTDDIEIDHGTHVAGIIGAIHNDYGVAGVANCTMYLLSCSNFVESLKYAEENDIKIINASFEFGSGDGPETYAAYNSGHYNALKDYSGLFIASAGNDDNDNDGEYHHYPSDYDLPNIISVGSIDKNGEKSNFSNYGAASVDVFAPGSSIYSTLSDNGYGLLWGTSMAAPHVTGVAALIYSKFPSLSSNAIKTRILDNVTKVLSLNGYCVTGGILNAYAALTNAYHEHSYSYIYSSKTQHEAFCACGDSSLKSHYSDRAHVYTMNGHQYATCLACEWTICIDDTFIQILKNPVDYELLDFDLPFDSDLIYSEDELLYLKEHDWGDKFILTTTMQSHNYKCNR